MVGLMGLKVQVIIDAVQAPNPSILPIAAIVGSMVDSHNSTYYIVRLDSSVDFSLPNGEVLKLRELTIAPAFTGWSIESLLTPGAKDFVPVGIGSLLEPFTSTSRILELTKVNYFARGMVRRA